MPRLIDWRCSFTKRRTNESIQNETTRCSLTSALLAVAASAGSVSGSWAAYGPQAGYSYYNYNGVTTNGTSGPVSAIATAQNQSGSNAPAGYMGVYARLFRDDGSLVWDAGNHYNSGPAVSITIPASYFYNLNWTYYSKGLTYAYNGNGYNTYSTFQSPFIVGNTP